MPASKTEEDIHYGEIDFSKRRPEPSSASEQDSGQQQDTLYAQVNVSETVSSLRQAADVPEDLYAQGAFENVPLSHRTVTRRVEDIAGNLELQLKNRAVSFDYFSLALDESCDVRDTAQLLIFIRGISTDFKITEELAAMQSMKGTTTGSDLFTEVNACLDKLGLKWDKLAGSPFTCSVENAPSDVQMELIDLQSDTLLAEHFSPSLFITTPKQMEALSGSCLQIPCNFTVKPEEEFNSTRSTFGVWIKSNQDFAKNPHNVIFNSSSTDNIYPMSLTGDLSQKNCTTLFSIVNTSYTDWYYFRIENRPFTSTAFCDPLQITVKDTPPRPSIAISGDLKEKQSVTITCSAFTPCPHSPPKLTWTLQQDPHNKIEENTDRTFTTKIQKTFTLSNEDDGFIITCSARYPVNEGKDVKTAEKRTTLNVSYAPKDTSVSISPSGLVSAGSLVNLTCSSRANPPVSFTWFKTSKDGPVSVAEGDFYSFKVTSVTDIEDYYCVATNDLGNQTSSRINNADNPEFGAVVYVTLKILGIVALYSTIIIFEWWFRSRCCNKPVKDAVEADYVNRVIEIQAS
ncbi:sialic acid-binding Ig-like lectin 14 [Sebastes fasciatus]|uniref:sialic acid-binding Ig-like lectin 14 n=1 Tax=Sebastes fasciatus TaxID=394691 RepID=UPI003D9E8761